MVGLPALVLLRFVARTCFDDEGDNLMGDMQEDGEEGDKVGEEGE